MALRGNRLADDVPVDQWQICRFTPPNHVLIAVGVAHAGKGNYNTDPNHKASSIVVDFITHETETSYWYFCGIARNFKPEDQALTTSIREDQGKIFSQDMEMLEKQQKNILANPQHKLLMLNIDAGGVQSRKILDKLMAEERETGGKAALNKSAATTRHDNPGARYHSTFPEPHAAFLCSSEENPSRPTPIPKADPANAALQKPRLRHPSTPAKSNTRP